MDLTASIGDTLSGKNLKNMNIIDEVLVEPTPEADKVILDRRLMVDDFPPFSKEEPLEAIMEYVRMQVNDGKDVSWFTYDMLPDTIEEMAAGEKRKKKKRSEGDDSEKERMKAAKRQKKEDKKKEEKKKRREIHLRAHTEVLQEGNSGSLPSSTILTSIVDTSSFPTITSIPLNPTSKRQTSQLPPRHRSTQVEIPITPTTIQTQTPPIITTTTSESTHSESTHSDSFPTLQTTPIHVLNPPVSQSDSEVSLSNYPPTKSSDFIFQDPPSPLTENPSKLKNSNSTKTKTTTPPLTIPTQPIPISTLPPVIIPSHSDTPISESIHVSAPLASETPGSEPMPISSAPATGNIPLIYLDISDDEILISDAIPTVTSPSDSTPQTELVPFQPIPNNLEDCINMFGCDALMQVSELRANKSLNLALVKKDWDQFRRWLADSFVKMENMVNSTKQAAIVAASERRMQYEQLVAARLAEQRRIQEERVSRELAEKVE